MCPLHFLVDVWGDQVCSMSCPGNHHVMNAIEAQRSKIIRACIYMCNFHKVLKCMRFILICRCSSLKIAKHLQIIKKKSRKNPQPTHNKKISLREKALPMKIQSQQLNILRAEHTKIIIVIEKSTALTSFAQSLKWIHQLPCMNLAIHGAQSYVVWYRKLVKAICLFSNLTPIHMNHFFSLFQETDSRTTVE